VEPGVLSPEEYDNMVNDLVNFIVYMGEPAKLVRYNIGIGVLIFLVLFSILLYLLKREYWRDIH
jgi:ubiquinol-cytochrome c reductase cytochrome c1 subunit